MALVGLAARKLSLKKRNAKIAAAFPNGVRCQKCLEFGHWSYECKALKRKYVHRTSRTKQLYRNLTNNEQKKAMAQVKGSKLSKKSKCDTSTESSSSASESCGSSDSEDDSSSDSSDSSSSSWSDSSNEESSAETPTPERQKLKKAVSSNN